MTGNDNSARIDELAAAIKRLEANQDHPDRAHLEEFGALLICMLLEEMQMRGAIAKEGQIAMIQGAAHLAEIGPEVFERVTTRVQELTSQSAQAAAATGDVNAAGKLMLQKRFIEKQKAGK